MKKFRISIYLILAAVVVWVVAFVLMKPSSEEIPESLPVKRPQNRKTAPPSNPPVDHVALLLHDNTSVADKINTVPLLSDELTFAETGQLLNFIKTSPNGDGEYVVKNNLMNKLLEQKTLFPDLSREFVSIAGDKNQNIVVRAYALQHLRPLYEQTRDGQIRDFFYQALEEEDTEIAGGALLALNYLSLHEDYASEFDRDPIVNSAVKISRDPNVNNNTRITAIQIAAVSSNPDYVDVIRNIISDPSSNAALRISAIAGLGVAGDVSDLATLQAIADGKRLEKLAAQVAVNKIKHNRDASL